MIKTIFILGRQPAIGRAELESVLGAQHLFPVGDNAMGCDLDPDTINFARFGGSTRLCKALTVLHTTSWPNLARHLSDELPKYVASLPAEGKLKLGLSIFGVQVGTQQLFRTGLELKKICKQHGRSVRIIPNTEKALSSAQVLHNQLTSELGMELLLIKDGHRTWLAQTVAVQDITAYAARDQYRPKRDARVGMLPPKLAQIIVNLATADTNPLYGAVVLDPFCGTGVVLQEAIMMGFDVYGTDLEPRMIQYTDENLKWLQQNTRTPVEKVSSPDGRYYRLEVGDATAHQWHPIPQIVACETYLGRPLSGWPALEKLHDIITTCNAIIEKSMVNIARQITSGTRLCLAVPAWQAPDGRLHHLPLLDRLRDLGYNRISFEHAEAVELVYAREGQFVARELLVIIRK
jgi:tRNA G10  N-methylase Trm11